MEKGFSPLWAVPAPTDYEREGMMRRGAVLLLVLFFSAPLLKDVADASVEVRREISHLQSPDPRNRVVAAFHIHGMGAEAALAIPFLIPLLSDHNNTTVPIPERIRKLLHDAAHLEHLPDYSRGVRHMVIARPDVPLVLMLSSSIPTRRRYS